MRIVGPAVLGAFDGRILNTHPSLLPAFPGAHAVADALAHGVTVTGCTVHLVDATLDGGPIVAQEAVADPARRRRGDASTTGSGPSSIGCCRGPSRCCWPARSVVDGRRVTRRPRPRGRARPRPAPRAAVRLGQDRPRRARSRPRRPRVRARLDRRHGAGAARRRPAGDRRRRRDRVPRDARRPGQDAPPAGPRRPPRRSPPGRPPAPAAGRGDRAVRARRRQPLPVRGRPRAARASRSTSSSRRSTSAGRRWSGRRPRTTPTSRS